MRGWTQIICPFRNRRGRLCKEQKGKGRGQQRRGTRYTGEEKENLLE